MTDRNPYRPGASVRPEYLAGRDDAIARFAQALGGSPEIPANIRLSGLRGVGKSVLLQRFEEVSEDLGWLASRVELEPRHNTQYELARLISQICDKLELRVSLPAKLRKVTGTVLRSASSWSMSYEDVTVRFDPGAEDEARGLVDPLYRAVQASGRVGRAGIAVLLDEAQVLSDERTRGGEHPLSMLISAVSGLQALGAPLVLVLCGLPTLQANLLRARTYTERMFRGEDVRSLPVELAKEAFLKPLEPTKVSADASVVNRVVEEVDGYPYFIQLWGAELWDAAHVAGLPVMTVELLDAIEFRIYERLDRDFYEGRLQTLTPAEQDLLLASSGCSYPPLLVSELRTKTDKSEKNVNVLVGRLADQGVIHRIAKGQYHYSAPKFHEFLGRRVDKGPPIP